MKSTIDNEQIRHALLLQPDHFCWAGKEILTELRSLITDIRLDLKDAAETEANLDVPSLQLERLDKALQLKISKVKTLQGEGGPIIA